jgi:hypothetical protein
LTQICNNIYKICQASTPFAVAGLAFINNPYVLIWLATAISFINMSQVRCRIQTPLEAAVQGFFSPDKQKHAHTQELHKWSHMSPSECHPLINTLQDANFIIGRKPHLAHHRPPFDGNYCIVSGHCNP